ncbi:Ubiquitin-conjugating enzyme [Penicillium cataractarum]|uniref:Ubiquitin-conjugating enzyme n=1 Tax=Penicillium cataractarum TaxID=2100454 RepID=A0A9W9S393_9EURO|nr:Ubiquitin-conjugating enzyme [Penicillium cataractarum]KAJ5371181.1 Ubiquitin-conjugating enzyme [Penicillium cataractarum]
MTSPSTRRLLKESTDIHKNPSPYFTASPISDSNLHDWHFTLTGPPSPTPYANGLYHGRITFPPTYPLRPPSFRFLTPSGRFEVNREICLSISGHHEETWQPAWGVRTALLAIRSEIMGAESKGQVGGMEGSEAVRREFARESRGWVCRECGGSNEEVMRGWWEVCRERGVEVDFEGSEVVGGEKEEKKEMDDEEGGEKDDGQTEVAVDKPSTTPATPVSASAVSPVPPGPSGPSSTPAVVPPAPSTQSNIRPRPTPTSPAPVAMAARTAAATQSEPANSPWLDRAIIGIVFALIILITKRTVNVDDL